MLVGAVLERAGVGIRVRARAIADGREAALRGARVPPAVAEQVTVVVLVGVEADFRQGREGCGQGTEGMVLATVEESQGEGGPVAAEGAEVQVVALGVGADGGGFVFGGFAGRARGGGGVGSGGAGDFGLWGRGSQWWSCGGVLSGIGKPTGSRIANFPGYVYGSGLCSPCSSTSDSSGSRISRAFSSAIRVISFRAKRRAAFRLSAVRAMGSGTSLLRSRSWKRCACFIMSESCVHMDL